MSVVDFIQSNIDLTTKMIQDVGGEETLIKLPYPFTTPCIEGIFQEMYYWDTYFTQKALYLTGRKEQAWNNVRNFTYLLNTYGKILNGNRTHFLKNSQPPFFGLMLFDLLSQTDNCISYQEAFECLEKEYAFWMSKRVSSNGLNHYDYDFADGQQIANPDTVRWYRSRTGVDLEITEENCRNIRAEAESGWDFSARYNGQCANCNAIDLNCLLYADELLLSEWATRLNMQDKAKYYLSQATFRKEKMFNLMRDEKGVWYDYNFVTRKRMDVISCAAFFPYFVGLDNNQEGYLQTLSSLETPYGVIASTTPRRTYQWAAPNGWAPLHYVAVAAAEKLALKDVAKRLAEKYLRTLDNIFTKTGRLWEKVNIETGDMQVTSEYRTPEMLGWTAGVYMAFDEYRKNGKLI